MWNWNEDAHKELNAKLNVPTQLEMNKPYGCLCNIAYTCPECKCKQECCGYSWIGETETIPCELSFAKATCPQVGDLPALDMLSNLSDHLWSVNADTIEYINSICEKLGIGLTESSSSGNTVSAPRSRLDNVIDSARTNLANAKTIRERVTLINIKL